MSRVVSVMFLAVCGVVMGGCASMKSSVDDADDAEFSQYKTFALAPPPEAQAGLPGYTEIEGRRLQDEIARILEARGLQKVEKVEAADFFVSFSVTGQPRSDVWGTSGGWGYSGGVARGVSTTHYIHATFSPKDQMGEAFTKGRGGEACGSAFGLRRAQSSRERLPH